MCYDRTRAVVTAIVGGPVPRSALPEVSVPARIAAFLDGRTCGEDLLHALYDHILDEPIPHAMRAMLNK